MLETFNESETITQHPETMTQRRRVKHNQIDLSSAEIGMLWNQYSSDSMAACMLKSFLSNTKDPEIKNVIENALHIAIQHSQTIKELLMSEEIPCPIGFTDEDMRPNAPRLFTDSFHLNYVQAMARIALATYTFSLTISARVDIRQFFGKCIHSAIQLYDQAADLLLSKGLYIRPPHITMPEKVDTVTKQSYFGSFLGEKRTLNATEIAHIFINHFTTSLGSALVIGFSQVAEDREICDYFVRGRNITHKHIEVFHKMLANDYLPTPSTWNSDVVDSKVAPYSDRLMLYHILFLLGAAISNYGISMGTSLRKDIVADYLRLNQEYILYAHDGIGLIIKNGWMEEPPQADDRDALVKEIRH